MKRSIPEMTLLLEILDQGYEKSAWHGPNLKQSLRGVSVRTAVWRPGRGRHNIWEYVLHAAYWKYAVRRRLQDGPHGSFTLSGSNWFASPATPTERAWKETRSLLASEHRKLRAAVAEPGSEAGHRIPLRMIFGVAFHDIYHAGQIRMLRRLAASGGRPNLRHSRA
jgi:DinB family protein